MNNFADAPVGAMWKTLGAEPGLLFKVSEESFQATGIAGNMSVVTAERVFGNVPAVPLVEGLPNG